MKLRAQRQQLRREVEVLRVQIRGQVSDLRSMREQGASAKQVRKVREDLEVSRSRLKVVHQALKEMHGEKARV